MHWRNPAFLWFEIVPGVALVGWVVEVLTALEKKLRTSPHAFLDNAHRVLAQYAKTIQRSHNLGVEDTMLDRCWISVQRFRFDITPLSSEVCKEILNSMRQIMKSKL